MSVLIPNASLGLRRVGAAGRDAHGAAIPAVPGPPGRLLPGKTSESPDGRWQLALDPALWPVRAGDLVVDDRGSEWLVVTCQLVGSPPLPEAPAWAGEMDVSFVRVTAVQRGPDGTEPGGREFVGR